jgi:hypothetical protein
VQLPSYGAVSIAVADTGGGRRREEEEGQAAGGGGGLASRPLTSNGSAPAPHFGCVCVWRPAVTCQSVSPALPHSPTKLGVCSPSFVPFLSCVKCPYRLLLSSVSLAPPLSQRLQPRAAVARRGCSVAHTRSTLRCAPPAHPRPFPQSASQQLRSSWGSPRARWRIRRVSRGMQPRLCLQLAPPQLAARPLHSQNPPRRPSHPLPQGLFAALIPPKLIATRTKNPARTPLSPST